MKVIKALGKKATPQSVRKGVKAARLKGLKKTFKMAAKKQKAAAQQAASQKKKVRQRRVKAVKKGRAKQRAAAAAVRSAERKARMERLERKFKAGEIAFASHVGRGLVRSAVANPIRGLAKMGSINLSGKKR
jgi:hypothetical protein